MCINCARFCCVTFLVTLKIQLCGLFKNQRSSHIKLINKILFTFQTDIARGYQPAYSNWNKQPMQAVFRQAGGSSSSSSGGSSGGYSTNSGSSSSIPDVSPAPGPSSSGGDSVPFPDVGGMSNSGSSSGGADYSGSSGSSKSGSFHTSEASIPPQFRARAAAVRSTATSDHSLALKPVSILQHRSTGAENAELSGEAREAVEAMLLERESEWYCNKKLFIFKFFKFRNNEILINGNLQSKSMSSVGFQEIFKNVNKFYCI